MNPINEELNKLDVWKDRTCELCNAKYPKTILNIEGYIHHKSKLTCLNQKTCRRRQRHNK